MPKTRSKKNIFLYGILLIIFLTVLSQLSAVMGMILAKSLYLSESFWAYLVSILRTLLDSLIYASGAAFFLYYIRRGNKKMTFISFASAVGILFIDYGISYVIDLSLGNLVSIEIHTFIYLLLNLLIRAVVYGLIILFASNVYKSFGGGNTPVPFVSTSHPTSKMLNIAFIFRMIPYLLFEVYSNITGIIEYGFDMTASDVLSIISAYVEIFIDGLIIYIAMYLFTVYFIKLSENKK